MVYLSNNISFSLNLVCIWFYFQIILFLFFLNFVASVFSSLKLFSSSFSCSIIKYFFIFIHKKLNHTKESPLLSLHWYKALIWFCITCRSQIWPRYHPEGVHTKLHINNFIIAKSRSLSSWDLSSSFCLTLHCRTASHLFLSFLFIHIA